MCNQIDNNITKVTITIKTINFDVKQMEIKIEKLLPSNQTDIIRLLIE